MAHYNGENKNMKNDSERLKHLKKMTQLILLPLSVFSLFLSHSSLSPLFLDSYDYFNHNFKFKLFTYTTERNCIFLLCNGILVFIIQSSGLIDSGPKTRPEKDGFEESKKKEILEEKISFSAQEDLQNFEEGKWDEHDDDEGIDAEELKKKCEDFIKKVKMEIHGASN